VVVALASCTAIDVVDILEKRRTPPDSLSLSVRFSRAEHPPRRITQAHLTYTVATASERPHVERAIQLSFDRYCSVAHSLAPDTELTWDLVLTAAPATVESAP
jgi:putative redox protein